MASSTVPAADYSGTATGPAPASGSGLAAYAGPLALAASGASALSSVARGQQQQYAEQYNAALAQQQGGIAEQQAGAEAQQVEQQSARSIGAARANAGASGLDPNQGSPVNVMADMAQQGDLSRQLTLYRGQLSALQASQQAALDTYYGQQASASGLVGAGSTLLTGAARYGQTSSAPSAPLM